MKLKMSLSNLDKDNTKRLFEMLSLNSNERFMDIIKSNYSSYGQLKLIAEQIYNLENKAREIIIAAETNDHLHNLQINCRKVCGQNYHHYKIQDREFLSIISPTEWSNYDEYLGKYFYNYDNLFYKV